jgi:hypothetical protein
MATKAAKKSAKKAPAKKTVAKKAPTKKATAPAKKVAAPAKPQAPGEGAGRSKAIAGGAVIRLLKDVNPRRQGTHAHAHYEKMKGGITVDAYLKKFKPEERKNARQWLTNTIRDGHAKALGA